MAIVINFAGSSLRKPGAGDYLFNPIMKKKQNQFKAVKGVFPCDHPRAVKSYFMKDESRPMYHCDICMVELVPVDDDETTEASEPQIVSAPKS